MAERFGRFVLSDRCTFFFINTPFYCVQNNVTYMYDSASLDFSVNFNLLHNNCNDDLKQIIYCNELKLHSPLCIGNNFPFRIKNIKIVEIHHRNIFLNPHSLKYINCPLIIHLLILITKARLILQNQYPRGDAGGLSRGYVLRIPSVL